MSRIPHNPYTAAQNQFDRIAHLLELDYAAREYLRTPSRELRFSIPVRMDDGDIRIFHACRVVHNDARGPAKGGIRFHPQESINTIRAMAMWTTWKCGVVDIPLGGSMGGVNCDPHDLSTPEQERLSRGWVRQIAKNLGPNLDVPEPDLMTSAQHMLWMLDEYEIIYGAKYPGFITGKPVSLGGSLGRKEGVGFGIVIALREALKEIGIRPGDTSASVQGFGTVGQNFIRLYNQIGGIVISIACWNQSDRCAYTFRKKSGIVLDEILPITNHFGEIEKEKALDIGYEVLPGDAWLEQEVDILIPAALENQIFKDDIERIHSRVKIYAEGANGPTTPEAEQGIIHRKIIFIPDLLANAGGAVVSYFEQVQSNSNYYWQKDEVLGKLDVHLTLAYAHASKAARSHAISLRDASYVIAVERVTNACRDRGWV